MYYAIFCEDRPNSAETRRSVRPAHLQRLDELEKEDRLLTAGPLYQPNNSDTSPKSLKGSLIIAKFDTIEHAKEWAAADPYVTADVYARVSVYPFKQVLP